MSHLIVLRVLVGSFTFSESTGLLLPDNPFPWRECFLAVPSLRHIQVSPLRLGPRTYGATRDDYLSDGIVRNCPLWHTDSWKLYPLEADSD